MAQTGRIEGMMMTHHSFDASEAQAHVPTGLNKSRLKLTLIMTMKITAAESPGPSGGDL